MILAHLAATVGVVGLVWAGVVFDRDGLLTAALGLAAFTLGAVVGSVLG